MECGCSIENRLSVLVSWSLGCLRHDKCPRDFKAKGAERVNAAEIVAGLVWISVQAEVGAGKKKCRWKKIQADETYSTVQGPVRIGVIGDKCG